jgi:rRNA maturation endonuclease Nob1
MVSQTATLKQITLTCVGCGSTVTVDDLAENIRNQTCKSCGAALIDRRLPGTSREA